MRIKFQVKFTFALQVVWMESLAFFTGNVGLLSKFIRKYREVRTHDAKSDIDKLD